MDISFLFLKIPDANAWDEEVKNELFDNSLATKMIFYLLYL